MKILTLTNNIVDTNTFSEGLALVKQWASTINLDLEFSIYKTTKQFTSTPFSNTVNTNGYIVTPSEIFQEAKTKDPIFDIAFLVFDSSKIIPNPTNPGDNGQDIQIPIQWFSTFPEVLAQYILHELCHYESVNTNKQDLTHLMVNREWNPVLYDQFATKPIQDWYLYLLNALINVPLETNLPPDDPSHMFNTATGALNPLYRGLQAPHSVVTPEVVSETIPQIITRVCLANGVEPELGIAVATAESNLNPKATLYNPPSKSTDRGLFMWNSVYHSEITDAQAFDPAEATTLFCKAVLDGKLVAYWSASEPHWKLMLSPAIKIKYGI